MHANWFRLCCLSGIVWLAGCQKADEIRSYDVPKSEDSPRAGSPRPAAPGETSSSYRIIGAMFPVDSPQWFFRISGPSPSLEPHLAKFESLLKTVRFPNGTKNPPVWDNPEGWKLGGPRPGRMGIAGPVETILIDGDKSLEITVTSAMGDPYANVRRWSVDLLGNPDFAPQEMANVTKTIQAQGTTGLLADVQGPKNPTGGRMMGGR